MAYWKPGPDPQCNCGPCVARRRAMARYYLRIHNNPEFKQKVQQRNKARKDRRLGPDIKD